MASACSAHPHPGQGFPDLRENYHYYVYVYNGGGGVGWGGTRVPWHKSGGGGITWESTLLPSWVPGIIRLGQQISLPAEPCHWPNF